MVAEKLHPALFEGTALALAVPQSLHIASQDVLMLNLHLTSFRYHLMKNLNGHLQEKVEQLPNY